MTGFARIDDPQPMAHLEMLDVEYATQAICLPCDTEAIAKSSMGDGKDLSGINKWYPIGKLARVQTGPNGCALTSTK